LRRSKEEAEATRERILDAAEQHFASQSIAKTRMEDIAKTAGVTRGAIYWHFKNKEELLGALNQRLIMPMESAMNGLLENNPDDIDAEKIQQAILSSLQHIAESKSAEQVSRVMIRYALCGESEILRERIIRNREGNIDRLKRLVEIGKRRGFICPALPDFQTAVHIHTHIMGIIHQLLSAPQAYPNGAADIKFSLNCLFSGLEPR